MTVKFCVIVSFSVVVSSRVVVSSGSGDDSAAEEVVIRLNAGMLDEDNVATAVVEVSRPSVKVDCRVRPLVKDDAAEGAMIGLDVVAESLELDSAREKCTLLPVCATLPA